MLSMSEHPTKSTYEFDQSQPHEFDPEREQEAAPENTMFYPIIECSEILC